MFHSVEGIYLDLHVLIWNKIFSHLFHFYLLSWNAMKYIHTAHNTQQPHSFKTQPGLFGGIASFQDIFFTLLLLWKRLIPDCFWHWLCTNIKVNVVWRQFSSCKNTVVCVMELEQIGCVKTHKSWASMHLAPDMAPILHITDVLQQTNIAYISML